jgi:predicted TPR repeat methyltransferase
VPLLLSCCLHSSILSAGSLGCGPGHVGAHLRELGLDGFGVDLSPGMVAEARDRHPRHAVRGRLQARPRRPEHVAALLAAAGVRVHATLVREPDGTDSVDRAYLRARKAP